jgi:hypothetical protein
MSPSIVAVKVTIVFTFIVAAKSIVSPVPLTNPLFLLTFASLLSVLNLPLYFRDSFMHEMEQVTLKLTTLIILRSSTRPPRYVIKIVL